MGIEYCGCGVVKIGEENFHLAVCQKCHTIVAMTQEERDSTGSAGILVYLDRTQRCCDEPNYYFRDVVPFPKEERCTKCGQIIKAEVN